MIFNLILQRLRRYVSAVWPEASLIILFVAQNFFFNRWLDIDPGLYVLRQILVTLSLGAILYGPGLFFKKLGRFIYLSVISLVISVIFISQFLYYEYSRGFLQISSIKYMGESVAVAGTIKTLLTPCLFLFLANILIVCVAFMCSYKNIWKLAAFSDTEKIATALVIIFIAFYGYNFLVKAEVKEWGNSSRLYSDVYDINALVAKEGIANFSFEDTIKFISKSGSVTSQDKDFLEQWSKQKPEPPVFQKYFGIAKGKNLIFIQVESLESSVINQKAYGQEITPRLNQLTKEGLYFSNYYTQVCEGNTADAEFVILNSLYPLADDVAFVDYARNKYYALPELLKENNYGTYSMHGDVPNFWNRSNIYPQFGYDTWFSESDYTVTRPVGEGPSDLGDEDFFNQSLPKLENLKQPFMATLITMSSHTPFILPEDLQTLQLPSKTNLGQTQWEYLQSIHYTDSKIGDFMDKFKKTDLYDNSIILIYGDHESFTDIGKPIGFTGNGLENIVKTQVPLIILAPGIDLPKGTSDIPASHLDIYPTVANLLGINYPRSVLGQDIFNTNNPSVTYRNSISGKINTILTSSLAYESNDDGVYEDGQCLKMPDKKSLPVGDCLGLYNQQQDTLKASDIVIKGDLLNTLLNP